MNRLLLTVAIGALAALLPAAAAHAQEPAPPGSTGPPPAAPTLLLPDGITIAGISVGGMGVDEARAAVEEVFSQPLDIVHGRIHWFPSPDRLGAKARIDVALTQALVAPPGSDVELTVTIRGQDVRAFVAEVERRVAKAPRDSRLKLVKLKPRITEPVIGKAVQRTKLVSAIVRALRTHVRGPIAVGVRYLKPRLTKSSFGPVVVIRRDSKRLHLYRGDKPWRVFRIATGQASYPTPIGSFRVVTKQRNPWWYPPDSDWAQGAKPVPPGPGNPLGTRWMGLSAPLIGIHGTPDAASIGYSASHGCIRMLVSEAEWLFERVRVGTPVFIVRA